MGSAGDQDVYIHLTRKSSERLVITPRHNLVTVHQTHAKRTECHDPRRRNIDVEFVEVPFDGLYLRSNVSQKFKCFPRRQVTGAENLLYLACKTSFRRDLPFSRWLGAPGTRSFLNFTGRSLARAGMWKSPITRTNTIV